MVTGVGHLDESWQGEMWGGRENIKIQLYKALICSDKRLVVNLLGLYDVEYVLLSIYLLFTVIYLSQDLNQNIWKI